MSEQKSEGNIPKFLTKLRKTVHLTEAERIALRELNHRCTDEVQKRIDELSLHYGKVKSLSELLTHFQTGLIKIKMDFLKNKEREEIGDINEEAEAFSTYLDQIYLESDLKAAIEQYEKQPHATVHDISKKINRDVRKAS